MKTLIIILSILFAPFGLAADTKTVKKGIYSDYIKWFGIKSSMPSINTEYLTSASNGKSSVNFKTHASGSTDYSIGTKYLDISISVPNSGDEEIQNSRYSDIYLQSNLGDFELTFHRADFKGGNVNEGPLTEEDVFFKEYAVNKINIRASYFFNTLFNKILGSPLKAREVRASKMENYFDSFVLSAGHDDSTTTFPRLSKVEVDHLFGHNDASASYFNRIETNTKYMSVGYAGMHMLFENFSYNFKISLGSGLQKLTYSSGSTQRSKSGISAYNEVDFGLNYLFKNKHNLGVSAESYTHSSEAKEFTIDSRVSQIGIYYQYFL